MRIGFYTLVHDGDVRQEPRVRLIMTTQGFMKVYARMGEIARQLTQAQEAGPLRPETDADAKPTRPSPNL